MATFDHSRAEAAARVGARRRLATAEQAASQRDAKRRSPSGPRRAAAVVRIVPPRKLFDLRGDPLPAIIVGIGYVAIVAIAAALT